MLAIRKRHADRNGAALLAITETWLSSRAIYEPIAVPMPGSFYARLSAAACADWDGFSMKAIAIHNSKIFSLKRKQLCQLYQQTNPIMNCG